MAKINLEIEGLLKLTGEIQWLGEIPVIPPIDSNPDTIHEVNFSNHADGKYTDEQFKSDWKGGKLYEPNTTQIKDGKLASFYPKGTWGRGGGLNQWVNLLPFLNENNLEEVYLSYSVMFEKGFDFSLVGKLPGFGFGSISKKEVASGGTGFDMNDKGASVRLVWIKDGFLKPYLYHHGMTGKYGGDLGVGSFAQLESGKDHKITTRVRANEIGKANGILQVWVDGILCSNISNIEYRTETSPQFIQEFALHTFMGGADNRFAPNHDQYMYLDNIKISHG